LYDRSSSSSPIVEKKISTMFLISIPASLLRSSKVKYVVILAIALLSESNASSVV
jgi:hypothetical protein